MLTVYIALERHGGRCALLCTYSLPAGRREKKTSWYRLNEAEWRGREDV